MNKTEDDELDAEELTEDELRQVAGTCWLTPTIGCRLLNIKCCNNYSVLNKSQCTNERRVRKRDKKVEEM